MSAVPPPGRPRVRTDDGMLTQLIRARRLGPQAVDAVRLDIERESRLGIGYLGVGAILVGVILIGRGLVSYGWTWAENEARLVSGLAWIVVAVAFAVAVVIARRRRGMLPTGAFLAVMAADAVALFTDLIAVALGTGSPSYATVGIGVGATVLACVTLRPVANILIANLVLTAISFGGLAWLDLVSPGAAGIGVSLVVLTVVPAFAGIVVVRSFGQLVQRELDRTVAESTIGAPRLGLGLLASTELARLDLAAEELLQDVASGRVALPLAREQAALASTLATDLRRLLVAGRRETWLHHAVTESVYLGEAVTLSDPDGLAGYLERGQRDGLLSAIWLVVDESGRFTPTIDLAIGRPSSANGGAPSDRMVLPIVITIVGIPRRRVEPAVWSALSRVGQYSLETRTGRLRIGVDAHVVVPDASR